MVEVSNPAELRSLRIAVRPQRGGGDSEAAGRGGAGRGRVGRGRVGWGGVGQGRGVGRAGRERKSGDQQLTSFDSGQPA